MRASVSQLAKNTEMVLEALERDGSVTITHHGHVKATLVPAQVQPKRKASEHPAFGMLADEMSDEDVPRIVRAIRKGRVDALRHGHSDLVPTR